MMDKSI
jgi:serine/threonine protein kinase